MKITLAPNFDYLLSIDLAKPDIYAFSGSNLGVSLTIAVDNKAAAAAMLRRVADELDPKQPSHEITIVDNPMGHKAECSCGWASAGWESYALAVGLGTDHVADMLEEERAGV